MKLCMHCKHRLLLTLLIDMQILHDINYSRSSNIPIKGDTTSKQDYPVDSKYDLLVDDVGRFRVCLNPVKVGGTMHTICRVQGSAHIYLVMHLGALWKTCCFLHNPSLSVFAWYVNSNASFKPKKLRLHHVWLGPEI